MTDSAALTTQALAFVRGLFRHRLAAARIGPEPLERFCHCEGEPPARTKDGIEVRVRTWRHWSDLRVISGVETGLEGWSIPRLADPPTQSTLSDEAAVAAARTGVDIPADAEVAHVSHLEIAPGCRVARVEWRRVHQGIVVADDQLVVMIHPGTKQVLDFFKRWRKLRLVRGPLVAVTLAKPKATGTTP